MYNQVVESDTEEGEVERSPRGAVVTGATTNTSPRDQQNPLDSRLVEAALTHFFVVLIWVFNYGPSRN